MFRGNKISDPQKKKYKFTNKYMNMCGLATLGRGGGMGYLTEELTEDRTAVCAQPHGRDVPCSRVLYRRPALV